MTNTEIAAIFEDIADLLKRRKDNIFKIRAYRRVAESIIELPVEVAQLVKEGRLKAIPGVGEAIAKKLVELATTGKLEYYERLRAEMGEVESNGKRA